MKNVTEVKKLLLDRYAEARTSLWRSARLWWESTEFAPSLRYLATTESHVYAFSIAANAVLAFFPFVLILLTICQKLLHWEDAYKGILAVLSANLPEGGPAVLKDFTTLLKGRGHVEVLSVVVMFYSSSGVFMPLEVALNRVWGIHRNRSLARNVALSFVLAVASGLLALVSLGFAGAVIEAVTVLFGWLPWHIVVTVLSRVILEVFTVPMMVVIYYMIYITLPNGKVPVQRVVPAAVVAGVLTELLKFAYLLTLPLLNFEATYGPFAVPVTLLFWAYLGSLVILWGAHLSARGPGLAVLAGPGEPLGAGSARDFFAAEERDQDSGAADRKPNPT